VSVLEAEDEAVIRTYIDILTEGSG